MKSTFFYKKNLLFAVIEVKYPDAKEISFSKYKTNNGKVKKQKWKQLTKKFLSLQIILQMVVRSGRFLAWVVFSRNTTRMLNFMQIRQELVIATIQGREYLRW